MKITYANRKIEKVCTDYKAAVKAHGAQMAEKIHLRIKQISSKKSIELILQDRTGRCHLLKQDRKGQYAMDLTHPYRLIFEVHGNEVQIANIIEITDYH